MKTPEQIATEISEKHGTGKGGGIYYAVLDAIEADRAQRSPQMRHIIFTGPFEEAYTMGDAERRIEELLDEGFPTPTVVNAFAPDGEVLGLTAHKVIGTAQAGGIG